MDVNKSNIKNIYPLSPMQEGLLFHSISEPDSTAYFQQISYTLRGPLDVAVFEQVWNEIIARHDILRSIFSYTGADRPLQVVLKERKLTCLYKDLRTLAREQQQAAREAFKQADRQQPFDLGRDLLMRMSVLQLQDNLFEIIWSHHHILMDGWSLGLLQQEFGALYRTKITGENSGLPPAVPFSRYIKWLEAQNKPQANQFWQNYLSGYQPDHGVSASLPERIQKYQASGAGQGKHNLNDRDHHVFHLNGELVAALNNQAAALQITLSTVLNGCWGLLLGNYNKLDDVVFGTAISGRPPEVPGVESMVGLFINTLPVRVRFNKQESLATVLQRLQKEMLVAQPYQFASLAEIQKATPLDSALIATHLTYENYPINLTEAQGGASSATDQARLSIESSSVFEQTHFDFDLQFVPELKGLRVQMNFNAALYSEAMVTRCGEHLVKLLTAFIDRPEQPIAQLNSLIASEALNSLPELFPAPSATNHTETGTLLSQFEQHAAQQPEAIAVTWPQASGPAQSLTYQALNAQANQLAHYLLAHGVGKGELIGILLEPSLDVVVALLGVLKTGSAYLPMERFYPAERLAYMLENAGIKTVISQSDLAPCWPAGLNPLCLDRAQCEIETAAKTNPEKPSAWDDLAYVIYTSGSTGKPKGVQVSHGNMARLFSAARQDFDFKTDDVWTLFHSFAFDFSVWEIWGALAHGSRLVIVPYWTARSAEDFYQLLRAEQVTVLNQTPSAFRQLSLAEKDLLQGETPTGLALRYVIFGGEKLELAQLRDWFERHADNSPQLVNMYGITETTVHVSYRPISSEDCNYQASLIGRPLADLQVYVLDEALQPVPMGVIGEMYVAGPGVTQGYLAQPELTQARFLPNPFSTQVGYQRLYKTGDAARWVDRVNGAHGFELEYLGRLDSQIQLHGFRIELNEVQENLRRLPEVKDAVVLFAENNATNEATDDATEDHFLAAYIIPAKTIASGNPAEFIAELQQALKQRLPEYMVPTGWQLLESFPLTVNGKLDSKALPKPQRGVQRPPAATEAVVDNTERDPKESALQAVWQQLMGLERIGREDNYFALGGDSIKAMQMISRLRKAGFTVEIQALFRNPTIAGLSPYLKPLDQKRGNTARAANTGDIPLLPVQQRFLSEHGDHPHWFNHAVLLQAEDGFQREALQAALNQLMAQHEALRARFNPPENGRDHWQQRLVESVELELMVKTLPDAPAVDFEQALEAIATVHQSSLNITQGPLIKAVLFVQNPAQANSNSAGLASQESQESLLLIIHHLLVDGVSWRILLEDLQTAYQLACKGETIALTPPSDSIAEWGRVLTQYRRSPALISELPYWQAIDRQTLPVIPEEINAEHASNHFSSNHFSDANILSTTLSAAATQDLLTSANQPFNTKTEDLLLTALAQTFHALYGTTTATLLMEGHGRETQIDGVQSVDLTQTVGWFTALYPFQLTLPNRPGEGSDVQCSYQIKVIKESLRQVPNRGLGYGVLRYLKANTMTDTALTASPQISFNYLGQFSDTANNAQFKIRPDLVGALVNPKLPRSTDIDISAVVLDRQCELTLQYNRHRYSEAAMQQLLTHYQNALEQLIAYCLDVQHQELTPSDLSYSDISVDELEDLFE